MRLDCKLRHLATCGTNAKRCHLTYCAMPANWLFFAEMLSGALEEGCRDRNRAERRREEHRRRKAGRSEYVQDMVANYLGAPEEVRASRLLLPCLKLLPCI